MGIFSDAQGHTPWLDLAEQISNPSEILWLSSIPARNKEGPIKNGGARVLTRFSPL